MSISKELPVTGYIKMVDIWMIFTMTYPFLVIILQTLKQICKEKEEDYKYNTRNTHDGIKETFRFALNCYIVIMHCVFSVSYHKRKIQMDIVDALKMWSKLQNWFQNIISYGIPIYGFLFTLIYIVSATYAYIFPNLDELLICKA